MHEKKPVIKKRIGPAMQWAKPRAGQKRTDDSMSDKISIDFDIPTEPEATYGGTEQTDRSTDSQNFWNDNSGSHANWGSPSETASNRRGTFTGVEDTPESRSFRDQREESAWNYYSGDTFQYNNDAWSHQDIHDAAFRSQQHPDAYEYQQASEHERSNSTAASTDSWSQNRSNSDGNTIRQFIAPFLVAALLVFLAFLTLAN